MDQPALEPSPRRPHWFQRIDRLLRYAAGSAGDTREAPSRGDLLRVAILCAAIYGLVMGTYALSVRGLPGLAQMVSSMIKVPLVFTLTIAVTYPSFWVLSALRGDFGSAAGLLRLQLVGTALATALLASLAPITAFFTLSTDSHAFMLVLNTAFFVLAALVGLRAMWREGQRVLRADAPERRPSAGLGLLRAWFVIAFVVGAQSTWILRPLIGRPGDTFTVFEPRASNAFEGFFAAFSTADN